MQLPKKLDQTLKHDLQLVKKTWTKFSSAQRLASIYLTFLLVTLLLSVWASQQSVNQDSRAFVPVTPPITNPVASLPPGESPTPEACPVLSPISDLKVTKHTYLTLSKYVVSWQRVDQVNHYRVLIDNLSNDWSGSCASLYEGDFCYKTTKGTQAAKLIQGQEYQVSVYAYNNCSSESAQIHYMAD